MEQAKHLQPSTDGLDSTSVASNRSDLTDTRQYGLRNLVADLDRLIPEAPTLREKIMMIEETLATYPQAELETKHHFSEGIYAREILIPKGTILTGAIHKTGHLNIISKGEIDILTEDGVRTIKAPFTIASMPGTKKIGLAHEDTIWTTIHHSFETDIPTLEAQLAAKDYNDPELIKNMNLKIVREPACHLPSPQ